MYTLLQRPLIEMVPRQRLAGQPLLLHAQLNEIMVECYQMSTHPEQEKSFHYVWYRKEISTSYRHVSAIIGQQVAYVCVETILVILSSEEPSPNIVLSVYLTA